MQRSARLQVAVAWRAGYGGNHLVRGYARWFGVDLLCAIAELRMLGATVDESYEQQVRRSFAARAAVRARAAGARARAAPDAWPPDELELDVDLDDCPF